MEEVDRAERHEARAEEEGRRRPKGRHVALHEAFASVLAKVGHAVVDRRRLDQRADGNREHERREDAFRREASQVGVLELRRAHQQHAAAKDARGSRLERVHVRSRSCLCLLGEQLVQQTDATNGGPVRDDLLELVVRELRG